MLRSGRSVITFIASSGSTGDAGHASAEEFDKFECSKMITHAYIYKKSTKFVWTFASYEEKDISFSDRNVFPKGCIIKMTRLLV